MTAKLSPRLKPGDLAAPWRDGQLPSHVTYNPGSHPLGLDVWLRATVSLDRRPLRDRRHNSMAGAAEGSCTQSHTTAVLAARMVVIVFLKKRIRS